MYLIHADDETISHLIEFRRYDLPPREPVEVPDADARILMADKASHGLTEVAQTKTQRGIRFEIEEAIEKAEEELLKQEKQIMDQWAETMFTDRVKHGKLAIPPAPHSRVAKIMLKHGIDVKREYNLELSGTAQAEAKKAGSDASDRIAQLEADNAAMRRQLDELLDLTRKKAS